MKTLRLSNQPVLSVTDCAGDKPRGNPPPLKNSPGNRQFSLQSSAAELTAAEVTAAEVTAAVLVDRFASPASRPSQRLT